MAKQKKFGAFEGIFTPSILTILGVILYLRLGWVSGVAGIWGSIGVILLAHVISVTTGLSVSSIATDKKIKTGGIYYVLSRSLGLPMGGSIGLALFVGTALSISLYIVGFTENFLATPEVFQFLHLTGNHEQNMRIVGTVVLVILTILAFLSTDLALKTQFFILLTIVLSIVSILVGFFHPSVPAATVKTAVPGGFVPFRLASFTEVFALFFPAVTGFTAGIALSGDIKNPRTDIPKGTLLSILAGLIIYIVLAVGFNLFVDRNLLLNNYHFLHQLAWIPLLVTAGIWGATLSSALGGILGGPRILQAISMDGITPPLFGKTVGRNKEPRNALIFTFFISEIGILIGDLNTVARLVTTFYLTTYGIINLAFILEKWASANFRPSFRVSGWVGIIGFLTSVIIMFKMDMPAMFAAIAILGGLHYIISKKQLYLDISDVWPSVLASLIRSILSRFSKMKLSEPHWRANILLFSGGESIRPYLMAFSKQIAGKQGLISNFELVHVEDKLHLFPVRHEVIPENTERDDEGIFRLKQHCSNIYEGIEMISATYGFSGVEPNTIVLGWGRHTDDPIRFACMLGYLEKLNLNIVMLDYDKIRGFGRYSQVDVWLRGGSNNGNLMLALVKFLHGSYPWHRAKVRLLMITSPDQNQEKIHKQLQKLLESMRMRAEIKVITQQKNEDVHSIIKEHSIKSDLTFMGMAPVETGQEKHFIENADNLYRDLGTIVLVKASSFFSQLTIGQQYQKKNQSQSNTKKRKSNRIN